MKDTVIVEGDTSEQLNANRTPQTAQYSGHGVISVRHARRNT